MSSRVILPNKYQGEALGVVFDFTSSLILNEQLIDSSSVFIVPYLGDDPNVALMVSGGSVRVGNRVRQQIVNGVPGVTYTVTCQCGTSLGNFIRLQGFLTVLPSQP
jgi:hypothetical protein